MAPASKRQKLRSKVPPPCVIPPGYTAVRPVKAGARAGLYGVCGRLENLAREASEVAATAHRRADTSASRLASARRERKRFDVLRFHTLVAQPQRAGNLGSCCRCARSLQALDAAAIAQHDQALCGGSTRRGQARHLPQRSACHRWAEVSPETARQLGLLPSEASQDKPCLYSAWQVRGLLKLASGHSCLCKGMLMVNTWVSKGIWLREQCRKVQWLQKMPRKCIMDIRKLDIEVHSHRCANCQLLPTPCARCPTGRPAWHRRNADDLRSHEAGHRELPSGRRSADASALRRSLC